MLEKISLKDIDSINDLESLKSTKKDVKKTLKKLKKKSPDTTTKITLTNKLDTIKDLTNNVEIIDMDNFKNNKLLLIFKEIVVANKNFLIENETLSNKIESLDAELEIFMKDVLALDEIKQDLTEQIKVYSSKVNKINEKKEPLQKDVRATLESQKEILGTAREEYLAKEKVIDIKFGTHTKVIEEILSAILENAESIRLREKTLNLEIEKIEILEKIIKKIKKKEKSF